MGLKLDEGSYNDDLSQNGIRIRVSAAASSKNDALCYTFLVFLGSLGKGFWALFVQKAFRLSDLHGDPLRIDS